MDEMFITRILDIADPERKLSPDQVLILVEEKFTSTNKQSTPCCKQCGSNKVLVMCNECGHRRCRL